MSVVSVDNRLRFSASHPARKPFIKPKQGLGDSFSSKGTPPNKGSSGSLTRMALEAKEKKAKDKKAEQDWFEHTLRKLNGT